MAYNQIKRQDDEIKRLNINLQECSERELELKSQLLEAKHHLDDKEAKVCI